MLKFIRVGACCAAFASGLTGTLAVTSPWLTQDVRAYFNGDQPPPFFIPEFFPERDWIAERSHELARELRPFSGAQNWTYDAILKDIRFSLSGVSVSSWSLNARDAYDAAIAVNDCDRALSLFWDQAVRGLPYLQGVRGDYRLEEEIRWGLFSADIFSDLPEDWLLPADLFDHRYLAACLAFEDAQFIDRLILDWAGRADDDAITRPFVSYPQLVAALGSIHTARDSNFWHLIDMATRSTEAGYGPAGLLFVELALELDGIAVADDILHMLLLRAEATWPEHDEARPLPVEQSRIAELLPVTTARLSADNLTRAEQCFLTDEPYNRLLLGEAAYAQLPADQRC